MLFDGIYDPSKPCLFCEDFCANSCAIQLLKSKVFFETSFLVCEDSFIIINLFFDLFTSPNNYTRGDKKRYIIYAFISYLMQAPILEFIKNNFLLCTRLKMQIAGWINEYKKNYGSGEQHHAYTNTPFLNNMKFVLSYLEMQSTQTSE